jgi:hypothetical protein
MLHEQSAFAAKYEADSAPPARAGSHAPPRERWPIKWTIIGAVLASVALWMMIFAGARALWAWLGG